MGSISKEELLKMAKMQMASAREEKILVLVRLRPLSDKEILANEVADWECINDTTILYRNTLREGSTFPSACTFGKEMLHDFFLVSKLKMRRYVSLLMRLGLKCFVPEQHCFLPIILLGKIEILGGL
jgi:hypothetical protein